MRRRAWVAAAVVCGIAAGATRVAGGVTFVGYTPPDGTDGSFIEVRVTDDEGTQQGCPAGDAQTLWPQYNLASVLVPGLSPLAYANRTGADGGYNPDVDWRDPLFSALDSGSNGLPEWWNDLGGGATSGPRVPSPADRRRRWPRGFAACDRALYPRGRSRGNFPGRVSPVSSR